MNKQLDVWANEREAELFQTEKFKAMGRGDDYIFQVLAFTGNGSHQLSTATTILNGLSEVPPELKAELKSIQRQLTDFGEKLRNI